MKSMLRLFGTPHISDHERSQGKLPAKSYLAAALLELKYSGMVERHVLAAALWENSSEILANRSLRQLLVLVRTWEAEAGLRIFETGPRSIARGAGELGSDLAEFLRIGTVETRSQLARLSSLYAGDFRLPAESVFSRLHADPRDGFSRSDARRPA